MNQTPNATQTGKTDSIELATSPDIIQVPASFTKDRKSGTAKAKDLKLNSYERVSDELYSGPTLGNLQQSEPILQCLT